MALRVLLADESTTIKKVIQLALQDYGVEVKSVPIGLDVGPVAKSFRPDVIFVDVLLQKKSGYEVCQELKTDDELKNVPIILMWSGFMEIDEAKARASQANARLEKPFDADLLRKMVQDLVPRTLDNKLSSYLTFPNLPSFEDEPAKVPQTSTPATSQPSLALPEEDLVNIEVPPASSEKPDIYSIPELSEHDLMSSVDPEDQFMNTPLAGTKTPQPGPEESWSHQDLSKFKIQIPREETSAGGDLEKYMIRDEEMSTPQVSTDGEFEEITFAKSPAQRQTPSSIPTPEPLATMIATESQPRSALDQVVAEKILREEAQAVLEKVLWQILPDICERVVREELGRLLKDVEKTV